MVSCGDAAEAACRLAAGPDAVDDNDDEDDDDAMADEEEEEEAEAPERLRRVAGLREGRTCMRVWH